MSHTYVRILMPRGNVQVSVPRMPLKVDPGRSCDSEMLGPLEMLRYPFDMPGRASTLRGAGTQVERRSRRSPTVQCRSLSMKMMQRCL